MAVRGLAPHLDAADRPATLVHDHPFDLSQPTAMTDAHVLSDPSGIRADIAVQGERVSLSAKLSAVFVGSKHLKDCKDAQARPWKVHAVTGLGAGFAAAGLVAASAFWRRWSFFLATLFRSVTSSALFQASGWVLA